MTPADRGATDPVRHPPARMPTLLACSLTALHGVAVLSLTQATAVGLGIEPHRDATRALPFIARPRSGRTSMSSPQKQRGARNRSGRAGRARDVERRRGAEG